MLEILLQLAPIFFFFVIGVLLKRLGLADEPSKFVYVDEFNINFDAGIRATLVKSLFSEIKMEWKHDSEPAEDAERNDQRYILSLGWTFE